MKHLNKALGFQGEMIATNFLIHRGYKIIDKNFFCKQGEIDIIALDSNSDCICFIEVKSRYSRSFGYPCESVNYRKIKRLKNTANYYIYKKNLYDINLRFDIIEILFSYEHPFKINQIKNVI